MDEAPVRVEEITPAFLVAHVLEPGKQALARRMESSLTVTANSRIWTDRNRLAEASSFKFLA